MQDKIYEKNQGQSVLAKPEAARYVYDTFIENLPVDDVNVHT